jgi:putative FmdB family regulatory protein
MPIYEYLCQECGHKLEVMQRMSDALQTTCPSCSKEALKKLISPVGFQLKGTGWYVTDFRDKGKPKADQDAGGGKGDSVASKGQDEVASSKGKGEAASSTSDSAGADSSKAATTTSTSTAD